VPFDGSRFFALAFLGRFLVELASAELRQHAGLLTGSFEAAQGCVEVFAFSYTDARHRSLANGLLMKWLQKNRPAEPAQERHISRAARRL
jgi:hypothetical protein